MEINGGAHDYYNVLPNKSLWKAYVENGKKQKKKQKGEAFYPQAPSPPFLVCYGFSNVSGSPSLRL